MRKIDPNKTIDENYPKLNFKAAIQSNLSLFDAENDSQKILHEKFKTYVYIWEYGFYFISLFIKQSNIHKNHITIAALFTEVHSALRSAFIVNLKGYHSDSIVLLRKVHESLVRALACKSNPQRMWDIIQTSDVIKMGNKIGLDLKTLYNVESSFTHSNKIKSFQSGVDFHSGQNGMGVTYGPQINEKEFNYSATVSIFWLYATMKSLSKLFPDQVNDYWLLKQEDSAELMRDFLENKKSSLINECNRIDSCIKKL